MEKLQLGPGLVEISLDRNIRIIQNGEVHGNAKSTV